MQLKPRKQKTVNIEDATITIQALTTAQETAIVEQRIKTAYKTNQTTGEVVHEALYDKFGTTVDIARACLVGVSNFIDAAGNTLSITDFASLQDFEINGKSFVKFVHDEYVKFMGELKAEKKQQKKTAKK